MPCKTKKGKALMNGKKAVKKVAKMDGKGGGLSGNDVTAEMLKHLQYSQQPQPQSTSKELLRKVLKPLVRRAPGVHGPSYMKEFSPGNFDATHDFTPGAIVATPAAGIGALGAATVGGAGAILNASTGLGKNNRGIRDITDYASDSATRSESLRKKIKDSNNKVKLSKRLINAGVTRTGK